MILYLWIALGGAAGSVLRAATVAGAMRWAGSEFPWGTLLVNVAGSFAIGFFATHTAPDGRWPVGDECRAFFMTGVLGGFTTFSAFSLQTLDLMRCGAWLRASGNVVGSVTLCLLAAWLGHLVATTLAVKR
jgi:CrcB protein